MQLERMLIVCFVIFVVEKFKMKNSLHTVETETFRMKKHCASQIIGFMLLNLFLSSFHVKHPSRRHFIILRFLLQWRYKKRFQQPSSYSCQTCKLLFNISSPHKSLFWEKLKNSILYSGNRRSFLFAQKCIRAKTFS